MVSFTHFFCQLLSTVNNQHPLPVSHFGTSVQWVFAHCALKVLLVASFSRQIGRRMSSCDLNPAEVSLFGLTPIFGLTARLSPSLVSVCSCRTSPLNFFWQTLLVPILELKRTRNGSFSLSKPSFNPGDMIFKERVLQTASHLIKREAASYLSIGL